MCRNTMDEHIFSIIILKFAAGRILLSRKFPLYIQCTLRVFPFLSFVPLAGRGSDLSPSRKQMKKRRWVKVMTTCPWTKVLRLCVPRRYFPDRCVPTFDLIYRTGNYKKDDESLLNLTEHTFVYSREGTRVPSLNTRVWSVSRWTKQGMGGKCL
jgi:hypothetical protein